MKKYIYMICALLTGALASCSQNELATDESNTLQEVTLQVDMEQNLNTRIRPASATRYAIEVYTDATYATPANVFANTNKATSTNGSFSMILDRTQEYHCLIWADKAGTENYDVTSLKAVALKDGMNPVEAWHGTLKIEAKKMSILSTTLHRAVAKISLLETGLVNANSTLALTFKQRTTFDVSSAATTTDEEDRTETITIESKVEATPTAPVKLNNTDIFVLASVETADQLTLAFQMGTDPKKEVSNVPLKANHNTNIKGHYSSLFVQSFTVNCDDAWEPSDNVTDFPEVPKAGYFYYKDNTVSATLDATKECVGIVYWINSAHPTNGSAISLDEFRGKINECQLWISSKHDNEGLAWGKMTDIDVKRLVAGTAGLKWVISNPGSGQITEWDRNSTMPGYANYTTQRSAFNAKLIAAGGTALHNTDPNDDMSNYFTNGGVSPGEVDYVNCANGATGTVLSQDFWDVDLSARASLEFNLDN